MIQKIKLIKFYRIICFIVLSAVGLFFVKLNAIDSDGEFGEQVANLTCIITLIYYIFSLLVNYAMTKNGQLNNLKFIFLTTLTFLPFVLFFVNYILSVIYSD